MASKFDGAAAKAQPSSVAALLGKSVSVQAYEAAPAVVGTSLELIDASYGSGMPPAPASEDPNASNGSNAIATSAAPRPRNA
jgi:hypothetical protein